MDAQGKPRLLGDIENAVILHALEFHRYNLTKVSRSLKVSRGFLYRRLKGLDHLDAIRQCAEEAEVV